MLRSPLFTADSGGFVENIYKTEATLYSARKKQLLLKTFGTILIKHIFKRALKGHLNANDAVLNFLSSTKMLRAGTKRILTKRIVQEIQQRQIDIRRDLKRRNRVLRHYSRQSFRRFLSFDHANLPHIGSQNQSFMRIMKEKGKQLVEQKIQPVLSPSTFILSNKYLQWIPVCERKQTNREHFESILTSTLDLRINQATREPKSKPNKNEHRYRRINYTDLQK